MTRDDRGTALFLPLSVGRHKLYIGPWENENNKQLLGEVFLISEIIEVEVSVISQPNQRLRLITFTETLII